MYTISVKKDESAILTTIDSFDVKANNSKLNNLTEIYKIN